MLREFVNLGSEVNKHMVSQIEMDKCEDEEGY